jgi:hypothetical protein
VEVHQKSHANSTQSQLGKQLSIMDRKQFLNAFEFHNDRFLDNEIYAITAIQLNSFVPNRKLYLATKREAA